MRAKVIEVIRHNGKMIEEQKADKIVRETIQKISHKFFGGIIIAPTPGYENLWVTAFRLQPLVLYRKTPKKKG